MFRFCLLIAILLGSASTNATETTYLVCDYTPNSEGLVHRYAVNEDASTVVFTHVNGSGASRWDAAFDADAVTWSYVTSGFRTVARIDRRTLEYTKQTKSGPDVIYEIRGTCAIATPTVERKF